MGPEAAGITQIQQIFQRLINLSVGLAFVALVVMFVWGGAKLIMSGGDQKALAAGKQTILWAIVGILFMALAWVILLIIKAFTGVDVTHFCLGFPGGENKCPS